MHPVCDRQKCEKTARYLLIAYDDGIHMGSVFSGICVFVGLSVFPQNISKTDADRITKLHTEMFHNDSWKHLTGRISQCLYLASTLR